ncbi:MAG TPA: hypothetical protein VGT61_07305 [Thermomicrobiales bacterium]|jgi:hypothetical protein|nr:hypothetical protein [Thermomicrobiales bacterium]
MTNSTSATGSHDFDFLFGDWRIDNRRLVSRLSDSTKWATFTALGTCHPILGGIGNVDDFRPQDGALPGYEGASIRLFDPASGMWSIHWADNVRCALLPPMVGRFEAGEGIFYGDEVHDGTPVRARFVWSRITPHSARWEQAFSADGGTTWEHNWTMDFSRMAPGG